MHQEEATLYEVMSQEPDGFPHMKLFRFDDTDVIAAYNEEDARVFLLNESGMGEDEISEGEQISEQMLDRFQFIDDMYNPEDDDEGVRSFREQLYREMSDLGKTGEPFFFASSEY